MLEIFAQVGTAVSAWLTVILIVLGFCGTLIAVRFATKKALDNAIEQAAQDDKQIVISLSKKDESLDRRVSDLEKVTDRLMDRLDATPSRDELYAVKLQLETMQGDMKSLGTEIKGLTKALSKFEKSLDMLVEHHMVTRT